MGSSSPVRRGPRRLAWKTKGPSGLVEYPVQRQRGDIRVKRQRKGYTCGETERDICAQRQEEGISVYRDREGGD